MKLLFLFLSSFIAGEVFASSCCVSNTSVSNLMILPSKWQQTFSVAQNRIIGDVNDKGKSTFRDSDNRDVTNTARLDLAYGWTGKYQSGVSLKYQNRTRELSGDSSSDSGWSDVGLSHAYKLPVYDRLWAFQTLNIPTASSIYDSKSQFKVDAMGTGTYQTSAGVFGIHAEKVWDLVYSSEIHHSFARTIRAQGNTTEVGSFWGGSLTLGAGYVPFRSKIRYGVSVSPRYEEAKNVVVNGTKSDGQRSLLWDSGVNLSYTYDANYAFGASYVDQTLAGPARNTLLGRTLSVQLQSKW